MILPAAGLVLLVPLAADAGLPGVNVGIGVICAAVVAVTVLDQARHPAGSEPRGAVPPRLAG